MGKISPVSAKYIIHSTIAIDGMVDRPDVIGAIFGQTEGLLGADLELRELQRSGRIGRIEVNTETKTGKTQGGIIIPSSLDKAETAIVGAALEIITRIGPCNAKIQITKIEDVRISKRTMVVERAKELLRNLMDTSMPDSQELADEVSHSVRVMEITEYGRDKLPAGPAVEESDEIIIVEGRADVLNLLKHGIKNSVAINGTSMPKSIIELCARKIVTVFVDGDRGGDLIIRELLSVADIDYVTKAPSGMEVEELAKKEIYKALRSRVSPEQAKAGITQRTDDIAKQNTFIRGAATGRITGSAPVRSNSTSAAPLQRSAASPPLQRRAPAPVQKASSGDERTVLAKMLEDLIGTRGAYILDAKLNILGKVPYTELVPTIKSLSGGVHAIVFDGDIESELLAAAEKIDVKYLVGMSSKVKGSNKVQIIAADSM